MSTRRTTFNEAEILFMQRQRAGRLATSDEEGHPTAIPVCYAFDGQHFLIALDEKPKSVNPRQLKRVRNIEARHEASLLIDQYSDDWSQLGYVLIHARAEIIAPTDALHTLALPLLRARYVQYQTMALEALPMIVLTPERVNSWGPAITGIPF